MLFDISEKILQIKDEDGKETGATVKMKPLSVGDYQKLLTVVKSFANFNTEGKTESQAAIDGLERLSDDKVAGVIKEMLPKYCYDLAGIEVKDSNGVRNATIEDVITYGAFYSVAFKILIELITVSTATDDDKKK